MSFSAEYTRYQWSQQGDWRGVEPYVDHVILQFNDEYDEREDEEPERTETPVNDELMCISWKQLLPFRHYQRHDDGSWVLVEEGEQVFEDSMYMQRDAGATA